VSALKPHRVRAAGEYVLGCEAIAGVLEFELARKARAVVVLSDTAEWNQRPGIGKGPAPAIEADHAPKLSNRLAL